MRLLLYSDGGARGNPGPAAIAYLALTEKGEIVSCPGCGLELEVKQVKGGCVDLQELTIEGEDWGE